MALNSDELKVLIVNELEVQGIATSGEYAKAAAIAIAVANAVVEHITTSGVVTTIIPGGSSAGTYDGTIA